MKKLRKFLIASVMTLSVIAMSGFAALAPNVASAAASAGDLIKMEGLSSVYYLGEDGKRYVFPNESTYFSWYADFSGVVTIPASELQSYPLGGNVTMRPGTKLVKITTDPSVYAVESDGVLRKIQNESQAAALYGTNWNQRIVDIADSFFTNYTIGHPLADGEIPEGTLVKVAGDATVYYYDGTNYRSIASEAAMNANRFKFSEIITLAASISATGNSITGMEADLVDVSQGATGPGDVVTGSGLMVSLNAGTPASMNVPGNVSVEMLKVNLTAANDGPVNVSSIKLSAIGLSTATNIDDVTFYDNGMKVGTSKNVNSNREAIFNFSTPIYVAAGTTKTLTVKATIAVTTGTYGLGVASASDINSSGASVTGSFPVNGNLMSAVEASVGSVEISGVDTGDDTVSFGEDDVLLASFNLAAGNNEDALLQSLALYNGGTNDDDIISNLKLFINGDEVTTGSYTNRYAVFTLDNYKIEKGDNVYVEVKGDAGTTSSGDTIKMYLKDNNDLVAVGKTHGFGLTVTNALNSTTNKEITLEAGDFTIDMDKSATPAKDVKADDNDVVLATIKMTSNGENATLSEILGANFYIDTATTTPDNLLENIEMKDLDTGGIYDFSVAIDTSKIELTLDEEVSFVKGVTKTFELRADIVSTVEQNETFQVTLEGDGMTLEGDESGATNISVTPSSVTGSIITVKDASLTLTPTTLVSTSVVGGASDVIVYQGKVKAGTADDVRLQQVKLTSATSSEDDLAFIDDNITKLTLWLNGKELKSLSGKISGDSAGATETIITFNSLNTDYYTVPAGAEYSLVVTADFSSNLTNGDFELAADTANWIARSVDGSETVDVPVNTAASRVVTVVKNGSLNISLSTSGSEVSKDFYVLAGSENEAGRYLGELKFKTENEPIKVESLLLATSTMDATNADVAAIKLVDEDGNVIASESPDEDGDVLFDPFDIVFDADKTTSLFIVVEAKGINDGDPTSTATSGRTVQYELSTVEAKGESSGETLLSGVDLVNGGETSKTATIVGSKLMSVANAMTDGTLTGGTGKTLGKYTLVFDNGGNRATSTNEAMMAVLKAITITFSNTATVTDPYLYIEGYSGDQAATTTVIAGETTIATFDSSALANLVNGGEVDGSITLVVAGEVETAGENQYVQTSLADLADGDITYDADDADAGTNLTDMLLPYTSVDGASLSN